MLVALLLHIVSACQNGQTPTQRKEWRDLTKTEQLSFIKALNCLKNVPSKMNSSLNSPSLYDDYVYAHARAATDASSTDDFAGHGGPWFLPWHRMYLQGFETALQKECKYKGGLPYWDWTQDYKNIPQSPIFNTGLGSNGGGDKGCLKVGLCAEWNTTFPQKNQCISRKLKKSDPNLQNKFVLAIIADNKDFLSFSTTLESSVHGSVHLVIGGGGHTMGLTDSASNDPLFFLHHANIDRIWSLWRKEYPNEGYPSDAHSHFSTSDVGIKGTLSINDLSDSLKGRALCYKYVDPSNKTESKLEDFQKNTTISANNNHTSISENNNHTSILGNTKNITNTAEDDEGNNNKCFDDNSEWQKQMKMTDDQIKRRRDIALDLCKRVNFLSQKTNNSKINKVKVNKESIQQVKVALSDFTPDKGTDGPFNTDPNKQSTPIDYAPKIDEIEKKIDGYISSDFIQNLLHNSPAKKRKCKRCKVKKCRNKTKAIKSGSTSEATPTPSVTMLPELASSQTGYTAQTPVSNYDYVPSSNVDSTPTPSVTMLPELASSQTGYTAQTPVSNYDYVPSSNVDSTPTPSVTMLPGIMSLVDYAAQTLPSILTAPTETAKPLIAPKKKCRCKKKKCLSASSTMEPAADFGAYSTSSDSLISISSDNLAGSTTSAGPVISASSDISKIDFVDNYGRAVYS